MRLNSKGRILIVSETLNMGGAERQAVSDANLLAQHGWNVSLASWKGGDLEGIVCPDVALVRLQGENWSKRLLYLWTLCRRERYELIHSHLTMANLLSSFVGWHLRRPTIVTEHGLGLWRLQGMRFRVAVPLTYRLATRILAVCAAVRDMKIAQEGADPNKIRVMYNCYDPNTVIPKYGGGNVRRDYGIPDRAVVVGFTGRLVPVKRLDLLRTIAAKTIQHYPESVFLIVGDGPCRQELEALTNQDETAGHFRFAGTQTDVGSFYQAMDLFALTSEREALSIALIEAMACERPPVVFDVGGNGEVVQNGRAGSLISFGDCDRFASRLVQLARSRDDRRCMAMEARRVAEALFSPSARLAALEGLYMEMFGNRYRAGEATR